MIYRYLKGLGNISFLTLGTALWTDKRHNFLYKDVKDILNYAYLIGINLIDTAIYYKNYHLLKHINNKFFISTKSYCYLSNCIEREFIYSLKSLNKKHIDIFLLHEQIGLSSLKGHLNAYSYLMYLKEIKKIKLIGISTHYVKGVYEFSNLKYIDVIFALINYKGIHIEDGSYLDMKKAIEYAISKGKYVFAMEIFAEGKIKDIEKAIYSIIKIKNLTSIIIGVSSKKQLEADYKLLSNYFFTL